MKQLEYEATLNVLK